MCSTTSIGNKSGGSNLTTQKQASTGQKGQWVGGVFVPDPAPYTPGSGNQVGNTWIPQNPPPAPGTGNQLGNTWIPANPGDQTPPGGVLPRPGKSPLAIAMEAAQSKLDQWEAAGGTGIRGLQLANTTPTGVSDLKNYLGFLIPKRSNT